MRRVDYFSKWLCCVFSFVWMSFAPFSVVWGTAIDESKGDEKEVDIEEKFDFINFLKGKPTENQFYIGMFSYHFDSKSLKTRNWKQNLIGIQYNDFFLGTFENSFYNRTWTAGLARNFYTSTLSNYWGFATGYRLGLAYGYEEGEAPFSNVSPIVPIAGLYAQCIYREHFGVEIMLTTSLSITFLYQF